MRNAPATPTSVEARLRRLPSASPQRCIPHNFVPLLLNTLVHEISNFLLTGTVLSRLNVTPSSALSKWLHVPSNHDRPRTLRGLRSARRGAGQTPADYELLFRSNRGTRVSYDAL